MGKASTRSRLSPARGSVTSADGYRAAGIIINQAIAEAQEKCPKRITAKMQKTAAYRAGYLRGLVLADCLLALGEHPSFNVAAIQKTLSPNAPHERPRE